MIAYLANHHMQWNGRCIGAAIVWGLALLSGLAPEYSARAQDNAFRVAAGPTNLETLAERMNANTLTVVTGNPNLIFTSFGNDLAAVLNDGDKLRILPVTSNGAIQNVRDVLFLRGVDLGFTTSSILGYYRRTGDVGNIDNKIAYIAKLSADEIYVVTRFEEITSLEQLRGRKVSFHRKGSGTRLSAQDIFRSFNIDVEEVNYGPADAFEKLKTREIAAAIITSNKPARAIAPLKSSDGYHLIPIPYEKPLWDDYLPSKLTNKDYPDLIAPDEPIETIATSSVLITYNWPKNSDRYRRVEKFVNAFFAKFAEFREPPRHPAWRTINIFAKLPGWKRFETAEKLVASYQERSESREKFNQFLDKRSDAGQQLSDNERNQLFEEFQNWEKSAERQ